MALKVDHLVGLGGELELEEVAALEAGCAFINFTPSRGATAPALVELARERGVPIAGKDFKTGQTLLKTIVAPGLKNRLC